jgi:hypothetical protein
MKQNFTFKPGDVVLKVYAMPGPDWTTILLTAVDHEKNTATGWDLGFEFEVDNLAMRSLHLATDRDLDATIVTFGGRTVSYRVLAEEAAKRLGLTQ